MSSNEVFITATAAYLPNPAVSNDQMERILGQVGERPSRARRMILRSNGIHSRHYAVDAETLQPTHSNAALTAAAVRELASAEFNLDELQCLACGTSLPDQLMPNHAVMVQGELGLPALEAVATSGICMSGITALRYAYMSVLTGQRDNAIAAGSELSSALMHAKSYRGETEAQLEELARAPELAFEKDFLRWMLSDGAGAMLLQPQPRANCLNLRIDWIEVFSYAGEMEACMYAGATKENGRLSSWTQMTAEQLALNSVMAVKQDVKLLNENIIHYTIEKPLLALIKKRQLRVDDYDYFLPHYSSEYFRSRVDEGLQRIDFAIPQQRWFTNLTRKGNTGAASMYIMIDELLRSGDLQRGQRLLCWVPESGRFSAGFMQLTVV